MLKIDSDTHFTPIDAYDEIDPAYAEVGPHFVKLPTGKYLFVNKSREKFTPEHIRPGPVRQVGRDRTDFDVEIRSSGRR
jgi:hypothetical protein